MIRILIVEDEPFIQRTYRRVFEFSSFSVEVANDGIEALEKIEEDGFEMVLLDLMMPRMDGFQVLEKLRASTRDKNLPVIILTNYDDDCYVQKARNLGVTDYLIKSDLAPSEVVEKVRCYLKMN